MTFLRLVHADPTHHPFRRFRHAPVAASREKYPKQLLPLVSEDSLLQATIRRVDGLPGAELAAPMVVCNEEYRFVIAEQLRQMGRPGRIVLEPCGRNTAPALTLAALAAVEGGRIRCCW